MPVAQHAALRSPTATSARVYHLASSSSLSVQEDMARSLTIPVCTAIVTSRAQSWTTPQARMSPGVAIWPTEKGPFSPLPLLRMTLPRRQADALCWPQVGKGAGGTASATRSAGIIPVAGIIN